MVGKTTAKVELPGRNTSLGSALESEIIPSLLEAFTANGLFAARRPDSKSDTSAPDLKAGAHSTVQNNDRKTSTAASGKHRTQQKAGASTPAANRLNGVTTQKNVKLPSLKSTPRTKTTPNTEPSTAASKQARRTNTDRLSKARIDNWISTDEFALMVMADEGQQAQSLVNSLREADIPDEAILLELLAPTGAVLGRLWEQDLSSFAEITVGVCRLHSILRALHPADRRSLEKDAHGGRALLFTAPGEQHSFGLIMISELLFRSGWCVDVQVEPTETKILDVLTRQWFEFVGISLSGETHIDNTARLIEEIKRRSCNPAVAVVMGGHIFAERPELGSQLGADKVILDGAEVVKMTERYIPKQKVM